MYPYAMYPYAFIALDLANERAREAAHDRLVAEARAGDRPGPRSAGGPWPTASRSSAGAAPPPSAGSTNASPTTSAASLARRSRLTA